MYTWAEGDLINTILMKIYSFYAFLSKAYHSDPLDCLKGLAFCRT